MCRTTILLLVLVPLACICSAAVAEENGPKPPIGLIRKDLGDWTKPYRLPVPRCGRDIQQAEYSGWPMKNPIRQIYSCEWLREPLLRRLPDGSLFCAIYTGGPVRGIS